MDRDLRASFLAACTGAALSVLIGIIAGVVFLALILRALLCGIAIGGATYGIIALVKRTLPDLLEPPKEASSDGLEAAPVPEMGAAVDIVLPGDPVPDLAREPDAVESFAPIPEPRAPLVAAGAVPEVDDEPSLLEPEEGVAGAEAAIPAESGGSRHPSPGFDELDVLPDLDGFSDSFTASEFASGGAQPEGRPSSVVATPRTGQGNADTVAIAQAVRTILKRDQRKG